MGQISLFDHFDYLETLAKHKDPLEKLDKVIDWSLFRVATTLRMSLFASSIQLNLT